MQFNKPDDDADAAERLQQYVEMALDEPRDIDGFVFLASFDDGMMWTSGYSETIKAGYALALSCESEAERVRSRVAVARDDSGTENPPEGRTGFQ